MGLLDIFRRQAPKQQEISRRPPMGEVSYSDSELYTGFQLTPYNPDIFIRNKGGMGIYDKMRRDEMIRSSQQLKKLAVLCSGWDIETGKEEADETISEFVKDAIEAIPGTLEEKLKEIMTGMDYGFSITEKVFFYLDSGPFAGKLAMRLKTRKPHTWDFDTDPFGNLKPQGLWQNQGMYKYDPKKFVIYCHNREFDNWYGTSDLQSVYRSWWSKDVLVKFWNVYMERYGQGGIPMLHGKEGRSINENVYNTLKTALSNLQNRSVLAWDTDDAVIELLQLTARGQAEHERAIRYHDRAIGRGLLMPTGLGFSEDEKSGSKARSQTHFQMWIWAMNDLRRIIEETIVQEQIVKDLVDYNFAGVKQYPRFRFNPFDDDQKLMLAEHWIKAVEGNVVHVNADDEQHFRKIIEFPERNQDELEKEFEEDKERKEEMRQARLDGGGFQPKPSEPNNGEQDGQPKGKVVDIDKAKKEKQVRSAAKTWHRELDKFEKRVDFAMIENNLDNIEADARAELASIFTEQRGAIIKRIERAVKTGPLTIAWVQDLALDYATNITGSIKEMVRAAFELGRRDATSEIAGARRKSHSYIIKMPPKQTLAMLEKAAFWVKSVFLDSLLKSIQAILISGIENGEAPGEMYSKIRAAYEPYIGDTQVVADQRQIEPYRIETVIRTNTTKAYNRGRLVEFTDPGLDGFVRAFEISAILDTRTTDICRAADGTIVMLDDEGNAKRMLPPLHFNCRSIVIPVTIIDGEFQPSKQAELAKIKSIMPKDFGGDWD